MIITRREARERCSHQLESLGFSWATTNETNDGSDICISIIKQSVRKKTAFYSHTLHPIGTTQSPILIRQEKQQWSTKSTVGSVGTTKYNETTESFNVPCSALYSSNCSNRVSQGTCRGSEVCQAKPIEDKRAAREGVIGDVTPSSPDVRIL